MGIQKQILPGFLLFFVLVLCGSTVIATSALAQDVTQGYLSDKSLQNGMIVRLKPKDSTKVEALAAKDIKEMLGVVVSSGESAVSLANVGTDQQVYVATEGQYNVLVSTQSGPIQEGDFVTISSIPGVGMKMQNNEPLIIGKALKDFAGTTDAVSTMELQTNKGKKQVSIGRLAVAVSVAHNPLFVPANQTGVPQFLYKASVIIAERHVSAYRIYAGLIMLVLCILISGSILYAGVHSSMIAIGRNPLARHSIFRNLTQVIVLALIVFIIGVFAVYLLLKV